MQIWQLFIVIRQPITNLASLYPSDKFDILTSLNLSGTYPAQASTGLTTCTSPRELTMHPVLDV